MWGNELKAAGTGRTYALIMIPVELIQLTALMERTAGRPEIKIGLIDGPVFTQHPYLEIEHLRDVGTRSAATCARPDSTACLHGTFIAGILSASRTSPAPALCPNCTLLIRPIFTETISGREYMPCATPLELAAAILECIKAGARVINLSLALVQFSAKGVQVLREAFDHALASGVLIVAAAGNQGTLGSSPITGHPWVMPVVACDLYGRSLNESNLGGSIGRRGVSAPGADITSLSPDGETLTLEGTSIAAPFVTGAIALLWSAFPAASATQIKLALTNAFTSRASVVPPRLNAEASYQILLATNAERIA